ncbi:MAG: hypothetical protein Q6365_007045 [Candidatus Sigynarchaeota archaeon]
MHESRTPTNRIIFEGMVNIKDMLKKGRDLLLARAPHILILGGIQYLALSTLAMALYPGGTKYDPSTAGYLFWNNMISDMGRTVAHNGAQNTASCALFVTAMNILAVTFIPYYISLSSLFSSNTKVNSYARIAASLGIATGVLLALAAAFPQDLFQQLHLRFAQFSFVALAPAIIIYWWLMRGDARFPRPCSLTFLAFAITILVGIGITIASGAGIDVVTVTVQATTQKIMVYGWNACMPVMAWCLWHNHPIKKENAP